MHGWGVCVLGIGIVGLGSGAAYAGPLDELTAVAADKGPVIWYESSPVEQATKVIARFNETYPDIEIQFVRNIGGNTVAANVIQELSAGAPTASLVTAGAENIQALKDRDMLLNVNWEEIGVLPDVPKTSYALNTYSAVFLLIYNNSLVAEEDVPDSWEALTDPKWKGAIGSWTRALAFSGLAASWGEDQARDFVSKLADQDLVIYESTYPLAQQVGTGETKLGVGFYHSMLPAVEAGAPIGFRFLDPVPVAPVWSAVVADGGNPEGAQILAAWLSGEDGAIAYEEATGAGSPHLPFTKIHQLVNGLTISAWPFEETPQSNSLVEEFSRSLR